MTTTTTARVQVTIDISVSQQWTGDIPMATVLSQASAAALDLLNRSLAPTNIAIVGSPQVVTITTQGASA